MSSRPTPTDAELLRRSRADADAFGVVFDRHAVAIKARLLGRVGSEGIALELTAETFAQAWLHRRRFDGGRGDDAGPWLHGIATNLYRTWSHKQRVEDTARRRLQVPVDWASDLDASLDRINASSLGSTAIEQLKLLPRDQRQAVELRVLEELSYREIATKLGCSEGAARVRVHRGLQILNDAIGGRFE